MRRQNKTVEQKIGQGVLISGSSLVLQSVTRAQAGNYTCLATNLEGDAESNSIDIQIKCELAGKIFIFYNKRKGLSVSDFLKVLIPKSFCYPPNELHHSSLEIMS